MSNGKVLPLNDVMRIVGASGKQYKKVMWHTSEILVRHVISFEEYINMIHRILNECQDEDGIASPEMMDFSIRVNVIMEYALVQLPNDMDQLYYVVYSSDLYDTICSVVSEGQLKEIRETVDTYMKG